MSGLAIKEKIREVLRSNPAGLTLEGLHRLSRIDLGTVRSQLSVMVHRCEAFRTAERHAADPSKDRILFFDRSSIRWNV
jgi:hypothetical protein